MSAKGWGCVLGVDDGRAVGMREGVGWAGDWDSSRKEGR